MKLKIFLLLICTFYFNSCDILRFSLFEVSSWTPGEGFHSEQENICVSLKFSQEPNRASVERNFSLTADGNSVRGNFIWDGKKMIFSPLTSFEKNTDYIINLSSEAYDNKGLNMDEAFFGSFSTRPGNTRPVLISFYPEMYAQIDDLNTEIKLEFSLPVPLKTLYDNVSFSPSMTGNWRLENNGRLAVFSPAEPWTHNCRYEIRFNTSLTDNNGMNIGNDFLGVFTTGTDLESPYLLEARRITKDGSVFELLRGMNYQGFGQTPVENQNWEKEDRLLLIFSKPVDANSVRNFLSTEDSPDTSMETPGGFYTEIIFKFENFPVYESRFTFRIKQGIKDISGNESKEEYIYRIFANGKFSKPPVLMGLRMPIAPNNLIDQDLRYFAENSLFEIIRITDVNYPSGESIETWIELYFAAAEGSEIDLFSLMELFRIDTSNNVITFSPRRIKNTGFSVSNPQSGCENYQRIEITGTLINSTNFGIINFQIASGLKDNLGNRNENVQKISLIK